MYTTKRLGNDLSITKKAENNLGQQGIEDWDENY